MPVMVSVLVPWGAARFGFNVNTVPVVDEVGLKLALVFAETGSMDFAEVTQRAVQALGEEGSEDIALALDARVRHLLVDEFQRRSKIRSSGPQTTERQT